MPNAFAAAQACVREPGVVGGTFAMRDGTVMKLFFAEHYAHRPTISASRSHPSASGGGGAQGGQGVRFSPRRSPAASAPRRSVSTTSASAASPRSSASAGAARGGGGTAAREGAWNVGNGRSLPLSKPILGPAVSPRGRRSAALGYLCRLVRAQSRQAMVSNVLAAWRRAAATGALRSEAPAPSMPAPVWGVRRGCSWGDDDDDDDGAAAAPPRVGAAALAPLVPRGRFSAAAVAPATPPPTRPASPVPAVVGGSDRGRVPPKAPEPGASAERSRSRSRASRRAARLAAVDERRAAMLEVQVSPGGSIPLPARVAVLVRAGDGDGVGGDTAAKRRAVPAVAPSSGSSVSASSVSLPPCSAPRVPPPDPAPSSRTCAQRKNSSEYCAQTEAAVAVDGDGRPVWVNSFPKDSSLGAECRRRGLRCGGCGEFPGGGGGKVYWRNARRPDSGEVFPSPECAACFKASRSNSCTLWCWRC